MSFLSLFSDGNGWLATDQRVFGAEEVQSLSDAVSKSEALSSALQEQQTLLQETLQQVREKGYQEGVEKAQAEYRMKQAQAHAELHEQHARLVEEHRQACASLAVDIVRKIAGEVATEDWLLAQAEHAAQSLVDAPALVLRVHSGQVDKVRDRLQTMDSSRIQSVTADDALQPLACVLDTVHGSMDVELETQLSEVVRLFSTDEKVSA